MLQTNAHVAPILVTGCKGFLGSRVVALLEAGVAVVGVDIGDVDLFDVPKTAAFMRANDIATVVHLAATLDRRETPEAQRNQWTNTFELGINVFEAAVLGEVKRVIAAGSMDELGLVSGVVPADHVVDPISTYGHCKAKLFARAQEMSQLGELHMEWFRPSTIYGPGQRGTMLIPSAFSAAITGQDQDFTSGEQQRDFVYIDDVVDWIVRACLSGPDDNAFRVHHVSSGEPVSVREVLTKIASLSSAQFRLGALPRREDEPDLIALQPTTDDRSPLNQWAATTSLDEGLEQTWKWWMS